jgi:hypothetical protein
LYHATNAVRWPAEGGAISVGRLAGRLGNRDEAGARAMHAQCEIVNQLLIGHGLPPQSVQYRTMIAFG